MSPANLLEISMNIVIGFETMGGGIFIILHYVVMKSVFSELKEI